MRIDKIGSWLARLSDPQALNSTIATAPFQQSEFALLEELINSAGRHNVRPALVRNLDIQLRTAPDHFLSGETTWKQGASEGILSYARDLRLQDMAQAMLLSKVATEVLERIGAERIPAAVVKGVDFAEKAYGGLHARTFSDIDLLVRPEAESSLGEILRELGFKQLNPSTKRLAYTEKQWTRSDAYGGTTLVETHTDIVHAPELRSSQTLTYDLYADPAAGGISAASRLVLAGLHGATSHLFGRLQYVVDGMCVARMGADGQELRERAKRSGATLAVATMMRLASDIYDCSSSRALLSALGPIPWQSLERRLISGATVLSAKGRHRWMLLPRRYLYRQLLQVKDSRH